MEFPVRHGQYGDRGAFYIEQDGARIAEMTYRRQGESRALIDHTEVDARWRGKGVARQLLDAAVTWARHTNIKLGATCSYVKAEFARRPALRDVQG